MRRTLDGDLRAWGELWLALAPVIDEIAGRFRVMSRFSNRDDERRDLVVGVMARLHADNFERLALFHDVLLRRDGGARAWLAVVTRHAAYNHVRLHPENLGEGGWSWAELVPLPEGLDEQLPISIRAIQTIELHRVEACAGHELGVVQRRALGLWLAGHDHAEIAAALGIGNDGDADRIVRSAIKLLRRRLTDENATVEPRARK